MSVNAYLQQVVMGLIIIMAILFDMVRKGYIFRKPDEVKMLIELSYITSLDMPKWPTNQQKELNIQYNTKWRSKQCIFCISPFAQEHM